MVSRRRRREIEEVEKEPTKEELEVAKFIRFNVPVKEAKLVGMTVNYFIASEAVNALLSSKFATNTKTGLALFTNRSSCVSYCNKLLHKGLMHRAEKVKKKKKADEESKISKKREKPGKTSKNVDAEDSPKPGKDSPRASKKHHSEKDHSKKRVTKLNMHEMQCFQDGDDEIYVWIYDPMPWWKMLVGVLIVIGAIILCLFPLWPPGVRVVVYYLSLACAGLIGLLIVLAVVRGILFGLIWLGSFLKYEFWLFPNLFADCGVIESFQPLYEFKIATLTEDNSDSGDDQIDKSNANDIKDSNVSPVANASDDCGDKSSSDRNVKNDIQTKINKGKQGKIQHKNISLSAGDATNHDGSNTS